MALFVNEKALKPFPWPGLGLNVQNKKKTFEAWNYKIAYTITRTNINSNHSFMWNSCLPCYSIISYHLYAGCLHSHTSIKIVSIAYKFAAVLQLQFLVRLMELSMLNVLYSIIIIIIIILVIVCMHGIYNYIPETNHVDRVYI